MTGLLPHTRTCSEIASLSRVDYDRQVGCRTATSEAGLPSPAKIEAGRRQEGVTGGGGGGGGGRRRKCCSLYLGVGTMGCQV